MASKMWFVGGLAAGYVLGTRAGRQRYDQMAEAARKVRHDPTVQSAIDAVQDTATRLYTTGKSTVTQKLGTIRAGHGDDLDADLMDAAGMQP
jgi:hypothetical protein